MVILVPLIMIVFFSYLIVTLYPCFMACAATESNMLKINSFVGSMFSSFYLACQYLHGLI